MNRGTPDIQLATPGDIEGILALEASFPSDRMTRRSLLRLMRSPSALIWVVRTSNRGSDYIRAALVLLSSRNTRVARIYSLAVTPSARGQGLATALVETAHRQAVDTGKRAISLEVRFDNVTAQALYRRLGYTLSSTLPAYYADGSDGLRLQKKLRP